MRHRLLSLPICLLTAALLATPAAAQNTNVGEISLLFVSPDPGLRLQSGSLTATTGITQVDFVQEFGIEDRTFPEIRLAVGRKHKFRFAYLPVRYDADAVIQRTITFRDQTFVIGVPATTEIRWDIFRFGYQWDFVSTDLGFVGVVGELKYNHLDASIESPALARAATTEQKAPVPTVGVAGRGYVHPMVSIGAEFTGLKWDQSDFDATFLDFDLNGTVTFGRHIGVSGGYRSITVDYFIDDDVGDLRLKGPYIGVIARF